MEITNKKNSNNIVLKTRINSCKDIFLFKNKLFVGVFLCVFILLLCITILVGFGSELESSGIVINSIIPVYDETSTVKVNNNKVVFNDKNQEVKYNIVLENTNNYDVRVSDIKLSIPSEEFLEYEIENLDKEDVINAHTSKELVVSFETVKKEDWGRNFSDELTVNISFAKVLKKDEQTPVPEIQDKENEEIGSGNEDNVSVDDVPSQKDEPNEIVAIPFKDFIELKENFNLIDDYEIEEEELLFNDIENVVDKQKVDVWIFSGSIYLGRFEVEVKDGKTKIVGLSGALEKSGVQEGNHSLVLQTDVGEKIGYVEVKVSNKKFEKPVQEEVVPEEEITNKIEDNSEKKEETKEDNKEKNALLTVLVVVTGVTGSSIIVILVINKKKKTAALILVLLTGIIFVSADELLQLPLTFKISFESQNVMKEAYHWNNGGEIVFDDYWFYRKEIKEFYIKNETSDIPSYEYVFDVSQNKNGRVKAYLVKNQKDDNYYNLYLEADGIIYPNENASRYFYEMINLDMIDNLAGFDTSNVTNMFRMFFETGYNSNEFSLDLSSFNTKNVISMLQMFYKTGYNSSKFTLNVSSFDTSKVNSMEMMFYHTGYNSELFTLDLRHFDTSNVTNMNCMFSSTGYNNPNFTLDVSGFDTSKVIDMSGMFARCGYNNPNFTLDVSNFDMSNVNDTSYMFVRTGYNSSKLNVSIAINNPNLTSYNDMFDEVAIKVGAKITVNYTKETEVLVDNMIATKSTNSNVVKGINIIEKTMLKSGVLSGIDVDPLTIKRIIIEDKIAIPDNALKTWDISVAQQGGVLAYTLSNLDDSNYIDLYIQSNGKIYGNYDMSRYFKNIENLDEIRNLKLLDTSYVVKMSLLFYYTGCNSLAFTLDVSNFDTSNVDSMYLMFYNAGFNSTKFELDVSKFDTSNVVNMEGMFNGIGNNNPDFKLDVSRFNTSKVENMGHMFSQTGKKNLNFTIDVSNFDTSRVKNMEYMFYYTGYKSPKMNISITIRNADVLDYLNMFKGVAVVEGSQVVVNYTSETSDLVDDMIATKSTNSNVVKGIQVE